MLAKFRNARIYGYGATLSGRFDGADKLIEGLIGPVLARRTYLEAVVEGAICPIKVWMLKVGFPEFNVYDRDKAYRQLIYQNQEFNKLIKAISDNIVPEGYQTIIFADEKKQIELMNTFVSSGVQAVACKMKTAERKDLFGRMVRGEIKRCIATDIFSTGVTFPDVRCLINAGGGGGGITSTQKPGRLAEVRPNKTCGHVIDFLFECEQYPGESLKSVDARNAPWKFVVNDSRARLAVYQNNGYDVNVVESIEEIKIT
jgi:superfamily II DNA or RNA helicase